jgi:hypothetical protein
MVNEMLRFLVNDRFQPASEAVFDWQFDAEKSKGRTSPAFLKDLRLYCA